MKPVHVAIVAILPVLATVLALLWLRPAVPNGERAADAELAARLAAYEARVQDLERRLEAMGERSASVVLAAPATQEPRVAVPEKRTLETNLDAPRAEPVHEALWYLEQLVRSYDGDGEGSEYYRLVVDTRVLEVLVPVCDLVRVPERPPGLRLVLARMLAKARLRGDATALTVLIDVLRQNGAEQLALTCVQVWAKIAGPDDVPALEELVWRLVNQNVRRAALRALLTAAGARANATVLRLLASAPDDASSATLVALVEGTDLDAALAVFRVASQRSQPVRLAGARRIGDFEGDPFRAFVDDWLRVETDPEVVAALGGARSRQRTGAGWSAMQATGAPDANPAQDDPKAWAPRDPEMGIQWLELEYANPDRCSGVRIHEVCAPGAVAEIKARDAAGAWQTLWSGTTNPSLRGPLELSWNATGYAVRTLRVVLDTNRTPGWNEIDAVELVGASGRQYAVRAQASSTYAQRVQGGDTGFASTPGERLEFTRTKR